MNSSPTRSRLDSLDWLRGLVMVLMALDHVRDYVGPTVSPPELTKGVDLSWFMTRWVTHFCAPVFVFLAGSSAWLYGSRGRTTGQTSWFLLTRGLWLMLLELTIISCSWTFTGLPSSFIFIQVIFAIGASMVLLAGLIWLPRSVIAGIGIVILAGHNLLDGSAADMALASAGFNPVPIGPDLLYGVLRGSLVFTIIRDQNFFIVYPVLPWASILLLGYAFGPVIADPSRRVKMCFRVGLAMTVAFVLLRVVGAYGDPRPFDFDGTTVSSLISFLNTQKYPPSLQYALMTVGPSLLLLGWHMRRSSPYGTGWLVTFGRVPLFYYLLHIPLANAAGALWFQETQGVDRWSDAILAGPPPAPYEPSLLPVYAVWFALILFLYPLCAAYARFRKTARGWWWSYL